MYRNNVTHSHVYCILKIPTIAESQLVVAKNTHLANAIGIAACKEHKAEYPHCESFLEDMVALKNVSHEKYERKLKLLKRLDLLILDDFLLHTITDEWEIKVLFMTVGWRKLHLSGESIKAFVPIQVSPRKICQITIIYIDCSHSLCMVLRHC